MKRAEKRYRVLHVLNQQLAQPRLTRSTWQTTKIEFIQKQVEQMLLGNKRILQIPNNISLNWYLIQDQLVKIVNIIQTKIQAIFKKQFNSLNHIKRTPSRVLFHKIINLCQNISIFSKAFFLFDLKYYQKVTSTNLKQVASKIFCRQMLVHKRLRKRILDFAVKNIATKRSQQYVLKLKRLLKALLIGQDKIQRQKFNQQFLQEYLIQINIHNNSQIQKASKLNFVYYCKSFLRHYKSQKIFLKKHLKFLQKQDREIILQQHFKNWIEQKNNLVIFQSIHQIISQENSKYGHKIIKMYPHFQTKYINWRVENVQKYLKQLELPKGNILHQDKLYSFFLSVLNQNIVKIKQICENWLNQSGFNFEEKLASHIHLYLNTTQVGKNDRIIEKFQVFFKFLKDKQLFELFYRKKLVKRLTKIHQINCQFENMILDVFKRQCGNQWGKNIQILLRHFILYNEFEIVELRIFKQQSWPWKNKANYYEVNLDPQILNYMQNLNRELKKKYPKKYIKWDPIFGEGIIEIKLKKGIVNVRVSTVMMNLMLHFNRYVSFTLKQFLNRSHYNAKELVPNILELLNIGIVITQHTSHFSEDMKLHINQDMEITQPFYDLQFRHCIQYRVQEKKQLDQQKKTMIEALIIKVLKQQKQKNKNILKNTVFQMIQSKGYKANEQLFTKCIKNLIIKNYITQDIQNYEYVP